MNPIMQVPASKNADGYGRINRILGSAPRIATKFSPNADLVSGYSRNRVTTGERRQWLGGMTGLSRMGLNCRGKKDD